MGIVSSKPFEDALLLRDQNRFYVSRVVITNSRNKTIMTITPDGFPAQRYTARKNGSDDTVTSFVMDPDSSPSGPPSFLLMLSTFEEDLHFHFTFVLRQSPAIPHSNGTQPETINSANPTAINSLTFIFAPTIRDIDHLVTREFHADPNFHKNSNVELLGDYAVGVGPSAEFTWSWKWKPSKAMKDRGGGWRTSCAFLEYNQRAHRLDPLSSFSVWVQDLSKSFESPRSLSPKTELAISSNVRIASTQSTESRLSDSDGPDPQSPMFDSIPEDGMGIVSNWNTPNNIQICPQQPTSPTSLQKVDVLSQRLEDFSAVDDGPLFRSTLRAMEQRTGSMRSKWKKILKRAEATYYAQSEFNDTFCALIESLKDISSPIMNAAQPAMDHYFEKIAKEIMNFERQNSINLQKMVIDPISKLYNVDLKQVDTKKKDFDEESREFYAYVGRYLGQRQDSMKEKKRAETDSKYHFKRSNFELKRFDYSSFMQDLYGGRRDQEILSQITKYAEAQVKAFLAAAKVVIELQPQLENLINEVDLANKEFQLQRTEREEKRRALEKDGYTYRDTEFLSSVSSPGSHITRSVSCGDPHSNRTELTNSRSCKDAIQPSYLESQTDPASPGQVKTTQLTTSPKGNSKFKGYRDFEDRAHFPPESDVKAESPHRKEGLLWALSRPGTHLDPKSLNKQAWHKFWIVLDQGRLSEYTNWKQKLDLRMDPIDLRVASVREARNAERRFCFEVITPTFTRVYQATSAEDLKSWINSIQNAHMSAFEARDDVIEPETLPDSTRRDIASVLTGKSGSNTQSHKPTYSAQNKITTRHGTLGERSRLSTDIMTGLGRKMPLSGPSDSLLRLLREAESQNKLCADCGSEARVEWAVINLGIIVCIECSGIHRSLGTHISKVRSLTLDPFSFTPDVTELLFMIGNRVGNSVWEARITQDPPSSPDSSFSKPSPNSARAKRMHFISMKYASRAFVCPTSGSADEALVASISKNDISDALAAIAAGADVNGTEKSQDARMIHLALVHGDSSSGSASTFTGNSPSALSGSSNSPSHGPRSVSPCWSSLGVSANGLSNSLNNPRKYHRKPFPLAELLFLNGAGLPTQPAPFSFSPAALAYLEAKKGRESSFSLRSCTNGAPIASAAPTSEGFSLPSGKKHLVGIGHSATTSGTQRKNLTSFSTVGSTNSNSPTIRLQKRASYAGA